MNKNKSQFSLYSFAALCVVSTILLMGCQSNTPTEISAESDFKVIGYIRGNSKQFSQGLEAQLPYITHLNYSFINPTDDATGAIKPFNQARFNEFVERGKAANKSLFVSFGGWRSNEDSFDSVYERIAANPVARKIFIDNIVQMTLDYDLDGVDMDWEYPRIEQADEYADFIEALAQALHAHDKLLTAAIIGVETKVTDSGHADAYLDRAIAAFDWINLMAYDERPNDHSPYSAATDSIDYWVNQRGVSPHKAVLGLPIYARPSWRGFAEVISEDPLLACVDSTVHKGKTDYYNGLPMIAKKTRLAQNEQLAGVMVWELPLDSVDPVTSIMKQIVDTAFHGDPKTICDR